MSLKTAMILAAGRGSRLAPLTDRLPKPMVDIDGRPLIFHQLHWLSEAGVERVVINLHYLGDQISAAVGDGRAFGLEVIYSKEAQALETGGGIHHAATLLGEHPFILLNGDIFTDFDFSRLPHRLPPHIAAHILLTPTPVSRSEGDFGFQHRRANRQARDYVYCGISVMRHRFAAPPPTSKTPAFSLREPLFQAAEKGLLAGQLLDAQWTDIGTLMELERLRSQIKHERPRRQYPQ